MTELLTTSKRTRVCRMCDLKVSSNFKMFIVRESNGCGYICTDCILGCAKLLELSKKYPNIKIKRDYFPVDKDKRFSTHDANFPFLTGEADNLNDALIKLETLITSIIDYEEVK